MRRHLTGLALLSATLLCARSVSAQDERIRSELTASEARGHSFGTRSGIGVVVYF